MELKCPMCGGTVFGHPMAVKCAVEVDKIVLVAKSSWFGGGNVSLMGQPCLSCGYVALMVDPKELGVVQNGPV